MSTLIAELTPEETIRIAEKMISQAQSVIKTRDALFSPDAYTYCHTGLCTIDGQAIKIRIGKPQ